MRNLISSPKENKKWQIILTKIFNWCFLIAIILVLSCSIVFISGNDNLKHFNRFFMISVITLAIVIGAFLIYTIFRFFKKCSDVWNRRVQIINWILIILLAFTIAYTVQMDFQIVDADFCIKTAKLLEPSLNWRDIPYGNLHYGYFYALIRCYNLAPLIYFEAIIFKLCSFIGINLSYTKFVAIGTFINTIMLLLSMYLAFKLLKKHCSLPTQTIFTFLLLINIPLFAIVYNIYTDIPALFTVMLILFTYDNFLNEKKRKNKFILLTTIIFISIIGALLKFNVLIALFAIIIHYFLTHNWRYNIKFMIILLVPTILGISGIKRVITITSPIPQAELGLPATNWINMSFSKIEINGGYNESYFNHTLKLKNNHTNQEITKIEIKEFFYKVIHHPDQLLYMIYRKLGATYGICEYNYDSLFIKKYMSHPQMSNSILGNLIFGKMKLLLFYGSVFFQLSLFLLILLGTCISVKFKNIPTFLTPWMITLFGNILLLLIWETRPRYLIAFVGTIYLISCIGIEKVLNYNLNK